MLGITANRQVLFSFEVVKGKQARAVSGLLTADEALAKLLDGTGLTYEQRPSGVLMVKDGEAETTAAARHGDAGHEADFAAGKTSRLLAAQRGAAVADADVNQRWFEEVFVTARRRQERLSDVPVAVTFLGAQRLADAQVTTARQLVGLVPSLNINTGNMRDAQRYTLRGHGVTLGAGEGVSVYFAEAPLPQWIAGGPGLYYDLESVQVLNGPQGTLFGRNTTGGAVLFTPKRPVDGNEASVTIGFGTYDNRELTAVANVAVQPGKLSLRIAGQGRKRDGFTKNIADGSAYDDVNYVSLRAGLLFTPTDDIENYTLFTYGNSSTHGTGITVTDVNPGGLAAQMFPSLLGEVALQQARGIRVANGDAAHFWDARNVGVVNTTLVTLPSDMTIKNIFSYNRVHIAAGFDFDGTPVPVIGYVRHPAAGNPSGYGNSRNDYITEELQVAQKAFDGNLNWVVGAFYQHLYPYAFEDTFQTQFGTPGTHNVAAESGSTRALFGQATLDMGLMSEDLRGLKVTAGYRYTWDRKRYVTSLYSASTGACSGLSGLSFPNCEQIYAASFAAPTHTFGLDYKITPNVLAYFATRSGYKSGGFNAGADPTLPYASFGPEKVQDYELGLKAAFDVGAMHVRSSFALFRDDYTGIQRNQSTIVPGSNPPRFANVVLNAAAATIQGIEAQIFLAPTERIDVKVNYSFLDAVYDAFFLRGNDLKGGQLPYAPKTKVGVSAAYKLAINADAGDISVKAGVSYQSRYRWGDLDQPGNILGNYAVANFGLNWERVLGSVADVELFVTNAFDGEYKAGSLAYYLSPGTSAASYIEPRMFGARVRYSFGP